MRAALQTVLLGYLCALLPACKSSEARDWVAVSKDTLIVGVEIEGTLKATDSISVGPPGIPDVWEYKVARMAPEGEVVKVGDVVLAFDASTLQEELLREENRRDSTRTQLEKTQHEITLVERDEALALAEAEAAVRKASLAEGQDEELTSNLTLKKAKLDAEAARSKVAHLRLQRKRRKANSEGTLAILRSRVQTAEKDVASLQQNISDMEIKATRAGTVIYGEGWGGEKFKVGDRVWRAANVLEVATLDSMMAEGTIDEADSAKLEIGQVVHIRLEAHPDNEVQGRLTEIARNVQRKSREVPTKVVAVKLSIEPIDGLQMRPGMRFRGEVETERIDDALIVPLDAIFSSSDGPVAYKRAGEGKTRARLVLGKRGKRGVQVLKGLSSGDAVSRRDLGREL